MELFRTAAASTYVAFPMINTGGVTLSGLTLTGKWGAWSDTVGLTSAGNPGMRTLSGAFTESGATGIYGGFLAAAELPVASPYVALAFAATGAATQYLLVRTASVFANLQAVSSAAITSGSFAAGAIDAAAIAANAIGASEIADGAIDAGAIADGAIDAATFAANAIDAAAVADGAITAGTFAAGAVDAAALAADAVAEIADGVWDEVIYGAHQGDGAAGKVMQRMYHATDYLVASVLSGSTYADDFLGRNLHRGTSGGRTVGQALMALRNKVSISAGTLTVTGENDTTTEWTATIATQAVTAIVTSIDPA